MKNSSRFFANTDCEYFPCHAAGAPDSFSCLFCYCPLYMLGADCGGEFSFTALGVKDCSACLLPHTAEGWEYVTGRLGELTRVPGTERREESGGGTE